MTMKENQVKMLTITSDNHHQRIDNFLFNHFKTIPKGRIYKGIRKGEFRVNGKRIKPLYKLKKGDILRLPPFKIDETAPKILPSSSSINFLSQHIIYEDKYLMILNKPSGLPVHAGSGSHYGIIEILKQKYSEKFELAHRLDKGTSGCLLIAKKRSTLKELHQLLTKRAVKKTYLALLRGRLEKPEYKVQQALLKKEGAVQKKVKVDEKGKPALTLFKPLLQFKNATLVEVELHTGRMHQIRVHAASFGHPIAGDTRYGEKAFNQSTQKLGLNRLFLHAASIEFSLSTHHHVIKLCATLDEKLLQLLRKLE
jgi:23S rRNA pseudouridine955/2504/2580 synthase